jgi:uncharacterized protein
MMSLSSRFLAKVARVLNRITSDDPETPTIPDISNIPVISVMSEIPVISDVPTISDVQISSEISTISVSSSPLGSPFMINAAKLNSIVQNFVSSVSDIQGAAIVTTDGLALASVLAGGMDEERVAAMSAAMLSLGERISSELSRGIVDRIMIEGDEGYGVLTNCGSDAVLLVLASKIAKQGIIQLEIKRLANEVKLALS